MARDHRAGVQVEPRAARLGELLPSWLSHQSVSGARQLHSSAVAPVVALQAQGRATQGRDLSTLAPLRVNQHRTGTPLAIGANTFIQCHYQRFGGVPIGADQDPPIQRILDVELRWYPPLERGPGSVLIHTCSS